MNLKLQTRDSYEPNGAHKTHQLTAPNAPIQSEEEDIPGVEKCDRTAWYNHTLRRYRTAPVGAIGSSGKGPPYRMCVHPEIKYKKPHS
eukprot:2364279-Rhodomonas_salina.5